VRRDHQHIDVGGRFTHATQQLQAVHAGHAQVGDDQRGIELGHATERFFCARRGGNMMTRTR
jgi:hypothetical protein